MIGYILLAVILLVLIALAGYVIIIYNNLVRLKHDIDRAWSNIDVLLKQRYDELPKLVSVCEGYMKHERTVLENVTKARAMLDSAKDTPQALEAQNAISAAIRSLFAVVENYPELKADRAFSRLQARISQLEDQIADRRELYNASVNIFNIRIEQFPDVFVANQMRLTPRELWKIEPEHRKDVEIKFNN